MRRTELRALNLPIADELAQRAGSRPRMRPEECQPYAIAQTVPTLVFSPRTLAEASKIVIAMAAEGASIAIRGAGTKSYRPPHPYALDVVLDMTRYSGVHEHTPADLTVTVAAGTPFALLQETLREHGQFFPADPPFAAHTTVGGMLSARVAGALRQRYNTPRDSVLGMRVCLGDGSLAFTGSHVVKSVAGYDIPRLFVGSFGTLGIIGEVTLKVAPLPRDESAVVASFARCEDACAAARQIASLPLFPLATTLHDHAAARHIRAIGGSDGNAWTLVIRCGGTRATTKRQTDQVISVARAFGSPAIDVLDADRVHFAWADIVELAGGASYPAEQFLILSITSLPTQVCAVCDHIASLFADVQCTAHPANGIVYAHVPVAAENAATIPEALRSLYEIAERNGYAVNLLSAPPGLGARLHMPVPRSAPVALMRSVKAAFDPSGTFDPGRFVAGI